MQISIGLCQINLWICYENVVCIEQMNNAKYLKRIIFKTLKKIDTKIQPDKFPDFLMGVLLRKCVHQLHSFNLFVFLHFSHLKLLR